MGEHKSNPGAANGGAAAPSFTEVMQEHCRLLVEVNSQTDPTNGQKVFSFNPAQFFADLTLTEVRVELLFTLLVEAGIFDGKKAGDRLRDQLLGEVAELKRMKAEASSALIVPRR